MKNYLESLLQDCESELTKEVIEIALDHIDEYEEPIKYFEDVLQHGCVSGMVSELITYSDTKIFFIEHMDEIFEIYNEFRREYNCDNNMDIDYNDLSWLAFEETIRSLYDDYMATIEED